MASIFHNRTIIYITRDIERALGKTPDSHYLIVTNKTPYSLDIKNKYPESVFLIEGSKLLDTYELVMLPEVQEIISKHKAEILVFKNTPQIQKYCEEKELKLLNPDASLAEKIESKITQIEWLGDLSQLLPPYKIMQASDLYWDKKPFVLQWAHGHTGDGTILIQSEQTLNDLREKFPFRLAKITDYIKGPMFTQNIVVTDQKILHGNPSYQITGILPFTENIFSTVGNDWSLPDTLLSDIQLKELREIATKVGEKMQGSGWKGLFGIDVIYDEERNTLHLIEINARQPASVTFESEIQNQSRGQGIEGMTIFEAHLLALQSKAIKEEIILINDGAQILQRVTSQNKQIDDENLTKNGYRVIRYDNFKPNSDLLRIQSTKGIMEAHTKFNSRGKQIVELVSQ